MKIFDISFFAESFPKILSALPITLFISFTACIIAVIIGFFLAVVRIYKMPVLQKIALVYISFIRGTPVLVQLYIIVYGIPKIIYVLQEERGLLINIDTTAVPAIIYVLIAYSINISAYVAEIIRSAIEAVGSEQMEAALATGLSKVQAMRRIIVPQAFNVALPNFSNSLISAIKDTSLVFVAGVMDIMAKARVVGSRTFSYLEVYIAAALIYWGVCIVLEKLLAIIERRSKKYKKEIN